MRPGWACFLSLPETIALIDGEPHRPESWLHGRRLNTSWVQRLPWGVSHVQPYLPLLPLAIEKLDLSNHLLVTSSSHLVAKGVLTGPDQSHVSYVHTPARYAWDQMCAYLRSSGLARSPLGPWTRWQLHQLRWWDVLSSQKVDQRIAKYVASPGGLFKLRLGCEVARVGVSPLMHRHPLARLTPMRRDRLNLSSSRCRHAA